MKVFYIYIFILFLCKSIIAIENLPFIHNIQTELETINHNNQKKISSPNHELAVISSIIISGNLTQNKTAIKNNLLIRENDVINPYKINHAIKNLTTLGTFETVIPFIKKDISQNSYTLTLVCTEYPTIQQINFIGNQIITDQELLKLSTVKLNKIKNLQEIRETVKKINDLYKNKGYIYSGVKKIDFPKNTPQNLNIIISEALINSISITGNTKTRDYVILREIEINEGDILDEQKIQFTARKIYNLQHFENIIPKITLSNDKKKYDINYEIVEKDSQGSLSLGGGYGGHSGFSLFSNISWDNLKGTGQQLFLNTNIAFGNKNNNGQNTYQIKYYNPWAWNKRKSFTFRTWLTNGDLNLGPFGNAGTISYRQEKRAGYDIKIGWPHTYNLYTNYTLKYEYVDIVQISKQYEVFSGTYSLNYDKRDVRINPRKGIFYTASVEQSLKINPSMLNFNRIELTARHYIPTFKKQVIALKLELGFLNSPNINNENIYASEYYYIGGPNTVRGYDQMNPFAKGNKKVLLTSEYRIIFTQKFQLVFFVDIGYASLDNVFEAKKYKTGKGIGIRFNVPPLGPIKLDLGFDENNQSEFYFSMGQTF